jgi:hypothetical protein
MILGLPGCACSVRKPANENSSVKLKTMAKGFLILNALMQQQFLVFL